MFKFKNPKRIGSALLRKFGYVEFGQFLQPTVLHDTAQKGEPSGYFCANCKYFKKQEGTLYGAVCAKLQNAEVAQWGCCNAWEYQSAREKLAQQQATPEVPEPNVKPQPKPVQKPAPKPQPKAMPKPIQKPVAKPMPRPAAKPTQKVLPKVAHEPQRPIKKLAEGVDKKKWEDNFNGDIYAGYIKVLKGDKPKIEKETWDDPGDYPSNAGGGPLPSYQYISGLDGKIIVELLPEFFNDTKNDVDQIKDWLKDFADDYAKYEWDINYIKTWYIKIQGNKALLEPDEVDGPEIEREYPDEPSDEDREMHYRDINYLSEQKLKRVIREYVKKRLKEILNGKKTI